MSQNTSHESVLATSPPLNAAPSSLGRVDVSQCDPSENNRPHGNVIETPESGLVMAKVLGVVGGSVKVGYAVDSYHYCLDAVAVVGQPFQTSDIGSDVCLAFANNDFEKPIVLGKFLHGTATVPELNLESQSQITLRCGKASISLKADGTVAIRGTNVASRASHTNRIRGGNVQIN